MSTALVTPAPGARAAAHPTVPLRVALIGCGAVARTNLMPVLAGHDRLRVSVVVDRDQARAEELARAYNVPRAVTDFDALTSADIDAAVLATPPAHHAPATIELMARGLHVFAEKPMATTAADAEAMVGAADQHGLVLSVGLYRRLLPAVRLLRQMLESREFGRPLSIDIEEGGPYGWQLTTLAVLTSSAGGGGTLIDIGSHVIDLLLYVLPGPGHLVSYEDNARGGIETDCLARFIVNHDGQAVPVRVELSRTRELRGSIRVECEDATIELLRGNFTQLHIHRHSGGSTTASNPLVAQAPAAASFCGYDAFRAQFDDWASAILDRSDPILSGRSVLPVARLIDDCYRHRTLMRESWVEEGFVAAERRPPQPAVRRKRVLVTGAGGFLGSRTVELLKERYGCDLLAVVKEPKSAARLARWPMEIALGDVCSASDMDRVMSRCDAVVHCAVGTSWMPQEVRRVTVEGTRIVAEAALKAGVKRFVHISSMAVHQPDATGVWDEAVPLEPRPGDSYGRNKLEAEKAVQQVASRGLSAIVLRPARIYGPFSKTFTVRPLQALTEGRLALSGDPDVPANMVYVDNVVEAIARALEADDSHSGQAYLINDPDQLSMRAFFEYFGQTSGASVRVVPQLPAGRLESRGVFSSWVAGLRTIALSPEVRALVHRVLETDPVGTVPRRLWDSSPNVQRKLLKLFRVDAAVVYRPPSAAGANELVYYGGPAVVSSAKAERELDFHPIVPRDRAMALTLEWSQQARLVPFKSFTR